MKKCRTLLLVFALCNCSLIGATQNSKQDTDASSSCRTKSTEVELIVKGNGLAEVIVKNFTNCPIEIRSDIPFLLADTVLGFPYLGKFQFRDTSGKIIKARRCKEDGWCEIARVSSTLSGHLPADTMLKIDAHKAYSGSIDYSKAMPFMVSLLKNHGAKDDVTEFRFELPVTIIDGEKRSFLLTSQWSPAETGIK